MQFLCYYHCRLFINCQSASSFSLHWPIVAVAINYSNLIYQCFTNHYQSDPVLYITNLPMIICWYKLPMINCQYIISNHSIDNFLPDTNVLPIINFPVALGNLHVAANGLPLVPIGSGIWDIDWEHNWKLLITCPHRPLCFKKIWTIITTAFLIPTQQFQILTAIVQHLILNF